VQGAFISTDETERLMEWYKAHAAKAVAAGTSIDEQVTALEEAEKAGEDGSGKGEEGTPGERDTLFRQAAEVCIQNQLGSTSLLQRRMSIGYGRAARIIDQLELPGSSDPRTGPTEGRAGGTRGAGRALRTGVISLASTSPRTRTDTAR